MSDPYAIRDLEQLLATISGGDFRDDFYAKWRDFWEAMHTHCVVHDVKSAKGKMTIQIGLEIDRHGEIDMRAKADFDIPAPPSPVGQGRAFMTRDGGLSRHPQQNMPLIRDVAAPAPGIKDAQIKGE